MRLTPEGRTFQNSVSVALNHLLSANNSLRGLQNGEGVRLHVATDDSIAALWLAPRLHKFQERYPDINVRLTSSDDPEKCFAESNELAIVHGDGSWPGYECELFVEEEVFPVCAPAYLAQHGEIKDVADLAHAQLLDLEYERWSWMNWSI